MSDHATAGKAKADDALESAASALKKGISTLRRALREVRQAQEQQEADRLKMRLHIEDNHTDQEGHSE